MRNTVAFWWISLGVCSQANCLKIFFFLLRPNTSPLGFSLSMGRNPPETVHQRQGTNFSSYGVLCFIWSKISVDLGGCQLHNSCAIQENHTGLRRLKGSIKLERGRETGWVIFLSDFPLVSLSNAENMM